MSYSYLLLSSFFVLSFGLTGQEASQQCHCDVTSSFCDFNCCCDTDCSNSIEDSCWNSRSAQFCIQTDFYYKAPDNLVDSESAGCYYYNETQTIQEEVSLSDSQINYHISKASKTLALSSSIQTMYRGYRPNAAISIGEKDTLFFQFMNSDGECLSSSDPMDSDRATIQFRFRNQFKLTCKAASNSIKMFSSLLGSSVKKYDDSDEERISIPNSLPSNHNHLTIFFILGTYGSQKLYYIRQIQTKTAETSDTTRTLSVKFINPYTDYETEDESPSFFPQIPTDIFYPIQQIAFTF